MCLYISVLHTENPLGSKKKQKQKIILRDYIVECVFQIFKLGFITGTKLHLGNNNRNDFVVGVILVLSGQKTQTGCLPLEDSVVPSKATSLNLKISSSFSDMNNSFTGLRSDQQKKKKNR